MPTRLATGKNNCSKARPMCLAKVLGKLRNLSRRFRNCTPRSVSLPAAGRLTMENDFLERGLTRIHGPRGKNW